jgi:tetratricopeptide (TPR) repeat protein
MSEVKKDQVFVSYAREDLETVNSIVLGLQKRKLNVWFDKKDLGPGKWMDRIINEIISSRYFIFCMSKAASRKIEEVTSFLSYERQTAEIATVIAENYLNHEFTITPAKLEELEEGGQADIFGEFHHYELYHDFENDLDKLAVDIGGISLSDPTAKDNRTEAERNIDGRLGEVALAFHARDFARGQRLLEDALNLDPDNINALNLKGVALRNLGHSEEALKIYKKVLALSPKNARAWNNMASAYNYLGRFPKALEASEAAIVFNPKFASPWVNKSGALYDLGRIEEALEACEKAIEINAKLVNAWNSKGTILAKLNRNEDAIEAFEKAIEIDPKFIHAWKNKGEILKNLGRGEEAQIAFKIASDLETIRT